MQISGHLTFVMMRNFYHPFDNESFKKCFVGIFFINKNHFLKLFLLLKSKLFCISKIDFDKKFSLTVLF